MKLPEPPPPFRFSDVGGTRVVSSRAPFLLLTAHTSGPFGGGYEDEAKEWHATALEHGYGDRAVILDAGPRTTWRSATMLKPAAIAWALRAQPRPVVWLDADARIRGPLDLFESWTHGDLGMRVSNGVPYSGTLYFAQTPAARRVVGSWEMHAAEAANRTGAFPDVPGDQEILGAIARRAEREGDLIHNRLPAAYVFIFDLDRVAYPNLVPVVEHLQASRRRKGAPAA